MRTLDTILVAKKDDKQKTLIEMYLALEADLAFFTNRLAQLYATFATSKPAEQSELYQDVQIVKQLIETTRAYIEAITSTTTLGFTTNKMSDHDIAVFEAQAAGIKALRQSIESPEKRTDQLSQLIHDAPKMEYNVSTARRWLRRGAVVLGNIASAAIAILAVTALMTPGVNIIAAAVMIPTMLAAAGAYFYLRSPATTSAAVNVGPFHTHVTATVPSSLGSVAAAGLGISLFNKLRITNPLRETTARDAQAAKMNGYIQEIRKNIISKFQDKDGNSDGRVLQKAFLMEAIEKASKMYNDGMRSLFAETRIAKTTKARLILSAVTKILEDSKFKTLTVDDMLAMFVGNSGYSFEQLLNAKRNPHHFWQSKTDTMKTLRSKGLIQERNPKSISIARIAAAV